MPDVLLAGSPWIRGMLDFAFYYPLFMACCWIIGGIYYYLHWERPEDPEAPPDVPGWPGVTILIPCHNEAENVRDTIRWAAAQEYPNVEVLAIDDGSTDETPHILEELAETYERVRVVHLETNQGKAVALRTGALSAKHEYLVCIDGDALLDPHAVTWLAFHLATGPRVGAVTGNPRIRTRSTLLGKVQVGEFSSTIGLIKRAQRVYGQIFTVSGVVAAFKRSALHRVGYWDTDMVTEDIDVSWKLQADHWAIRYEPNALCWILMPETIRGLWRQRLRWAQGGAEVLIKHSKNLLLWRRRRMWGVFAEYLTSVVWAYTMATIFVLWGIGKIVELPPALRVGSIVPSWHGVILGLTCLTQFAVSLVIDRRYERGLGRYYYWMIWYPAVYWLLNMLTTVVAVPKALAKPKGQRARWRTTDRGLRESTTGGGIQ